MSTQAPTDGSGPAGSGPDGSSPAGPSPAGRRRPRLPAPERRTRRDVVAAAAIVVVLAVLGGVVWYRSDARATTSEPAATPAAPLAATGPLPGSLRTAWTAPSGATEVPAVAAGSVVAADGSAVTGHDPVTGARTWLYARDLPLCAVRAEWDLAVSVFRDSRGCSQVTALQGATGARGPQRSSDADPEVDLAGDGTYLTAIGSTRLEVWRSDLVRTLEYGRVDAPVNPGAQPRTGCTLLSTGSTNGRVAVVERCPGDDSDRLSLLASAPSDAQKPEELGSTLLGVSGARVLAVTGDREAVLLPGDTPRLLVADTSGVEISSESLPGLVVDPEPARRAEAVTRTGTTISAWVGGRTIGLSAGDLSTRWTLPDTLGPGVSANGELWVPVPGGVAVLDPGTGAVARTVAVDRTGYDPATDGPVRSAVAGDTLLEQRGPTLVALRAG